MKWKDALSWCRRYIHLSFILMVGILTYILFFSDNSVLDNYRYKTEIDALKEEIAMNYDTLQYYQNQLDQLSTEPEMVERIVREKYYWQKANEDVFMTD